MKNLRNKKIAIVHDAIVAYGGGESVLEVLYEMFPKADFYTSYVSGQVVKKSRLPQNIKATFLQKFGFIEKYPRLIQLLAPLVWSRFDFGHYDIVITHSGFYMSNLINLTNKNPLQFNVCYMITPPKNLYFDEHQKLLDKMLKIVYYPLLRFMDRRALCNTICLIGVSKDVQKRIKNIYGKFSHVLYPPVDLPTGRVSSDRKDYYCFAGRLSSEKNLRFLVETFNANKLPLLIIGSGKEKTLLKKIAHKNIKFMGFRNKKILYNLVSNAKAFVHVAPDDDFPLTPIQALGCGTPVITYRDGGTKEAIILGETGLLFDNLTEESLNEALNICQKTNFDKNKCKESAKKYAIKRFKSEFLNILNYEYQKFRKS